LAGFDEDGPFIAPTQAPSLISRQQLSEVGEALKRSKKIIDKWPKITGRGSCADIRDCHRSQKDLWKMVSG
jgi:hypothetical protein